MNDKNIRDTPALQKNLQNSNSLFFFKRFFPILKPFLKLLGINVKEISDALEKAQDLAEQAEELSNLPDRFNNHFLKRGWILYEMLDIDIARKAVEIADTGNIDEAEQTLIEYFSSENVRLGLNQMKGVKAFASRIRLAQLALKDYEEQRYHACIPVILALMDGLVNELNGGRGFFADDAELIAWNSISAHKKGLVELGKIFKIGRNKTRTEQIMLPFRNGIMHGNDLGYDNKVVAAKTWAALFAVREWALKAEKDELNEPEPKPTPTLLKRLNRYKEIQESKNILAKWTARVITVNIDFPPEGNPENYAENTPERKLVEFFTFWKQSNFGDMAKCFPSIWDLPKGSMPKNVRETYGDKKLLSFEILTIEDQAVAATEIETDLRYQQDGKDIDKKYRFRLLHLNNDGKPCIISTDICQWYMSSWGFFNQTLSK